MGLQVGKVFFFFFLSTPSLSVSFRDASKPIQLQHANLLRWKTRFSGLCLEASPPSSSFFSWGGTIPILLHFPFLCSFFLFPTQFFVFPNRSTLGSSALLLVSIGSSLPSAPSSLTAVRFVGLFRFGFSKPRYASPRQSDYLTRHHLHPRG